MDEDTVSVGTATRKLLALEKESWRKQFKFTKNVVAGVYTRTIIHEIETADFPAFNEALFSSSEPLDMETLGFDDARLKLTLEISSPAVGSYINVYLEALNGLSPWDTFPRRLSWTFNVLSPSKKLISTTRIPITTYERPGESYGLQDCISIAKIRGNEESMQARNAFIRITVRHEACSMDVDKTFLPPPKIDVDALTENLDRSLFTAPDVAFLLPDGIVKAHEKILVDTCKHFRDSFSSGFMEGGITSQSEGEDMAVEDISVQTSDAGPPSSAGGEAYDFGEDSDYEGEHAWPPGAVPVSTEEGFKVVKVPNFAARTFRAFLGYLYTGAVTFDDLRETDDDFGSVREDLRIHAALPKDWSCSPRSLYTLADYYDVPKLKELCKASYTLALNPENVLKELKKPFARTHAPIAEAIGQYMIENWTDITNEPYFDEAVQELMQYDKSREVFLRVLKQTKAA